MMQDDGERVVEVVVNFLRDQGLNLVAVNIRTVILDIE